MYVERYENHSANECWRFRLVNIDGMRTYLQEKLSLTLYNDKIRMLGDLSCST